MKAISGVRDGCVSKGVCPEARAPNHMQRFIAVGGERTLVLFIHGINGTPAQFDALEGIASRLGCAVLNLLLPGHGGCARDFGRSNKNSWLAYAQEAFQENAPKYNKILLAGHSMGSLISVELANNYPGITGGIFAVAMPLYLHMTARSVRRNIRFVFNKLNDDDQEDACASRMCSIERGKLWDYAPWLPRYIDLLRMTSRAKKSIRNIDCPIVAVHASRDELVSRRSMEYISNVCPVELLKTVELPCSSHYYYTPDEETILCAAFEDYVKANALV